MAKLLAAFFAAIVFAICLTMAGEEPVPGNIPPVSGLDKKYAAFNALWFNDELPRDAAVRYERIAAMGQVSLINGRYVIQINPKYNVVQRQADFTLLHEMSHIPCWGELEVHGPCFQGRMKYLAAHGAFDELW